MSLELLLADNDGLRKQLASAKNDLCDRDTKIGFLQRQLSLVRDLVRQIDQALLSLTAKLHFKEIVLVHSRSIRMDSAAFHDLMAEVGEIKEKMQGLHDALETDSGAADAPGPSSAPRTRANCSSPLLEPRAGLAPPTPLRKQISWDPSTGCGSQPGPSNADEQDDAGSDSGSESSQSLHDGILASASAGMIGLKTLQLFSKRSDAQQGPQSRRWYNRLRCCSFQECAVVIHLIYLHLISIVAVGGVTFLIVGIMLERKECLVAGTVMVIASYGLFLNHCFYRSAAVSSRPATQKLRIKDNDSIDLEASTNETINIDLTRPPTRNILQVDLDSSQLSKAY